MAGDEVVQVQGAIVDGEAQEPVGAKGGLQGGGREGDLLWGMQKRGSAMGGGEICRGRVG